MTNASSKPAVEGLVKLYNTDQHDCFACSPVNPIGLRMRFYSDGEKVYSWVAVPEHMGGWGRVAHGGIVSTLLDETMGWAGIYLLEQVTLTKTITVDFKNVVYVGEPLKVEAWVLRQDGRREAVLKGSVTNSKKIVCAAAEGVFTLLTPKLAKRLGVMTDVHIEHFFNPLINSKTTSS